jgi:hypothetical protein
MLRTWLYVLKNLGFTLSGILKIRRSAWGFPQKNMLLIIFFFFFFLSILYLRMWIFTFSHNREIFNGSRLCLSFETFQKLNIIYFHKISTSTLYSLLFQFTTFIYVFELGSSVG